MRRALRLALEAESTTEPEVVVTDPAASAGDGDPEIGSDPADSEEEERVSPRDRSGRFR